MTPSERIRVALEALQGLSALGQAASTLEAVPEDVKPLLRTISRLVGTASREVDALITELRVLQARGGVTSEDLETLNVRVDEQERALLDLLGG